MGPGGVERRPYAGARGSSQSWTAIVKEQLLVRPPPKRKRGASGNIHLFSVRSVTVAARKGLGQSTEPRAGGLRSWSPNARAWHRLGYVDINGPKSSAEADF